MTLEVLIIGFAVAVTGVARSVQYAVLDACDAYDKICKRVERSFRRNR